VEHSLFGSARACGATVDVSRRGQLVALSGASKVAFVSTLQAMSNECIDFMYFSFYEELLAGVFWFSTSTAQDSTW
jgi:hypothetical protein